jgi:hypothetical protein
MKTKSITVLICLIFIFCNPIMSQTSADTIVIKKLLGGYRYEMNGRNLRPVEVMEQIHENKQAFHLMQKARTGNGFASALSYAGGFLIGWPIGTAAGGGDAQWGMAAIGAGLVLVAIPISIQSNKNARKAVQTYNSRKKGLSFRKPFETELRFNGNAIGMILKL